MISMILAVVLTGQYRSCGTAYQSATFATPASYATYGTTATLYTTTYTPVVQARLVAVEHVPYASIVATDLRVAKATEQARSELESRLGRIEEYLARLTTVAPQPAPPGTVPPPPVPTVSKVTTDAISLMKGRCASCHSGSAPKGDLTLFHSDGSFVAPDVATKLLIDQRVYAGEMPPKKPLDSSEYSLMRAWIGESKAEIAAALKPAKQPVQPPASNPPVPPNPEPPK